jgi:hypothetical protein
MIGTTTDAGFRLDVNGTGRFAVTSGSLTLGATSANVTGIVLSGYFLGSGAISTTNLNARSFNSVIGGQNNGIVLSYTSNAQGQTASNAYYVASGNINLTDGAIDLNGFHFGPTIVSATGATIKAFSSGLSAATNRWNLFMSGSANNYLEGDTAIGTTTLGTATKFTLGGSETASSAIARGGLINTTLVAAANNDVLVGLDINPSFNTGAFTNVGFYALRVNGVVSLYDSAGATQIRIIGPSGSNKSLFFGNSSAFSAFQNVRLYNQATTNLFVIATGDGTANPTDRFFITQGGNVGINTSGTDAGFRLDVNGTARVQSTLSVPVTSSASITNASIATLAAGYSGSARTDAFIATNSAAGTGTNLGIPALNSGGSFAAIATTTGYNTGLRGIAFGSSSINMGFYGDATTGTSGNNIGAFGRANNSGAGMYVGGYFSNSITTTFPTISANAALIADNGTTSSDIFIAQVNGSAVLNIKSTGQLNTTGSITAASAIARGVFFNNTLVAAANNDVLVGLDINPTFTNGAFTGVTNYALRSQGRVFINPTIATTNSLLRITDNTNGTAWMGFSTTATTGFFIGANGALTLGRVAADNTAPSTTNATINLNNASENITLNTGVANKGIVYTDNNNATIRMNFPSANEAAITTVTTHNLSIGTAASTTAAVTNTIKFFGSSNNVGINQTTDAGFRLDVNGTARVQSSTVIGNNTTNSYIQLYNTASDTQSDGLLFASTGGLSGAANIQLGAKYGASNRADLVFKIFNGNYFEAIRLTASTNNVIIGGTAFTSDIASAKLQIISTTQGFLPPRMTTTQKNAISSPATGLVVYDTTLNKLSVYTGSAWETVTSL